MQDQGLIDLNIVYSLVIVFNYIYIGLAWLLLIEFQG